VNVPENLLSPLFWVRVRPSDEWTKAHPQASPDEPIPDDQLLVEVVCDIEWTKTSALTPPDKWPSQRIEWGVLKGRTMADLKRLSVRQLAIAKAAVEAAKGISPS
jgi:hypothetical protein